MKARRATMSVNGVRDDVASIRSARRVRHAVRCVCLLWLAIGCRASDATGIAGTLPAYLALSPQVSAAPGAVLEVRASYARSSGTRVELTRLSITLSAEASQRVPLAIDIARCVADSDRAGARPGCDVFIELSLVRNTTVLDVTEIGPVALAPGTVTTITDPVTLHEVDRIQISQASAGPIALEVQDTIALSAVALDRGGAPLGEQVIQWSSSDAAVVSVDSRTGRCVATAPGSAVVTARAGGRSAQVTVAVSPPAVVSVSLAPPNASIKVGEQVQLAATLRDKRGSVLTGRAVQWASVNPAVATVTATGLVTGVGVGSTSITATSETRSASALVSVAQVTAVAIGSVSIGGTQTPADLSAVSGTVDVSATYTLASGASATRLELLLNGSVAGSVAIAPSSCVRCTFPINTAAFNAATGAATYVNGAATLVARLSLGDNTTIASAPLVLALANTSGFVGAVSNSPTNAGFPGSATNGATGEVWRGGTVSLTLTAVLYAPSTSISTVSGSFLGRQFVAGPPSGNVFTVTFPNVPSAALSIAGYQSSRAGESPVITSSATSSGGAGPSMILNLGAPPPGNASVAPLIPVRVDNAPPSPPGVVAMPIWIPASFDFSGVATAGSDAGVGGVNTTVHVGTSLPGGCDLTGLAAVTLGSQLSQTTSPTYRGRAASTDALGNRACASLAPGGVSGNAFGADFTPPSASVSNGPQPNSIFSVGTQGPPPFSLAATDIGSGLSATPVLARITRVNAAGTSCFVGTGAGCTPAARGFTFAAADTTDGYFTASASVVDIAGNTVVAMTSRVYLVDGGQPAVGSISIPASLPGNAPATFVATVSDNVDLARAVGVLAYPAAAIQNDGQVLGNFGEPLERSAPASYTVPAFMRCINNQRASSVSFVVTDVAGLSANGSASIPAASIGACGVITGGAIASFSQLAPSASGVTRDGLTAGVPSVTVLRANLVGPSGTQASFQRVEFYRVDASGALARLGQAGAPTILDTGSSRTYTYSFTWDPASPIPVNTSVSIVAIGVDGEGDALLSSNSATVRILP